MERSRPQPPRVCGVIMILSLIALYVPLFVMIIGSFRDHNRQWTLRWYGEMLADHELLRALGRSLLIALGSAAGSTLLGLFGALALTKWTSSRDWSRRTLNWLSSLSLMLPELVLALSLLSWFALMNIRLSLMTVIAGHITLTLPFVLLVILARLKTLERSLDDAARDLGATETQILVRVTLPLLKPSISTGFLLAFLLSFDDFLITFYTNGAGADTLPVRLYSLMKTGLSPKVQALSSVMLLASIACTWMLLRLQRSQEQ